MVGIRQFMRPEIAASAIAHLSVLALVFVYAEAHPFGTVPMQAVNVDIVTPDEIEKPEPWPAPLPPLSTAPNESTKLSESSAPAQTTQPVSPAPRQGVRTNRKEAAVRPQPEPSPAQPQPSPQVQAAPPSLQPQSQPQVQAAPPSSPAPAPATSPYAQPEPDVTVKYNVMLGLPEALPPAVLSADVSDKSRDGGDAAAKADVGGDMVTAFRGHIKQCSKLPPSLSASDDLMIKLRILMTRDGRLAAEPMVKEGTASLKAVDLKNGAIAAIAGCQPYAELPADKYNEWKVIDLTFTPRDFNS
jgi:hypothetical protein